MSEKPTKELVDWLTALCIDSEQPHGYVEQFRAAAARLEALERELDEAEKAWGDDIEIWREKVLAAEAEVERVKDLYDEWGYADAPCPAHSKKPILPLCAACERDELKAKLEQWVYPMIDNETGIDQHPESTITLPLSVPHKLMRERDEARAEVRALRELLHEALQVLPARGNLRPDGDRR